MLNGSSLKTNKNKTRTQRKIKNYLENYIKTEHVVHYIS